MINMAGSFPWASYVLTVQKAFSVSPSPYPNEELGCPRGFGCTSRPFLLTFLFLPLPITALRGPALPGPTSRGPAHPSPGAQRSSGAHGSRMALGLSSRPGSAHPAPSSSFLSTSLLPSPSPACFCSQSWLEMWEARVSHHRVVRGKQC